MPKERFILRIDLLFQFIVGVSKPVGVPGHGSIAQQLHVHQQQIDHFAALSRASRTVEGLSKGGRTRGGLEESFG